MTSPNSLSSTTAAGLQCPKCAGAMTTYERSGIVVDQCRECRGIFLDRGELERLVDAEGGAWLGPLESRGAGRVAATADPNGYSGHADPRGYSGHLTEAHARPSKRRSLLGDVLEGFGD